MSKSLIKIPPPYVALAGLALVAAAMVGTLAVQRLSSLAGTAIQSGQVGNAAPSVDAVVPSDASGSGSVALPAAGFTLNEGATRTLYVRGTVSDPNGCEDIAGVSVTAYRPGVAFGGTDGMDAAGVLGQGGLANFTANAAPNPPSSSSLNTTYYTALDLVGRRLFVSDQSNHRVLVYDLNADGTPVDGIADHVLGHDNFNSGLRNDGGNTVAARNSFSAPRGLAWDADSSRLFVADYTNNRILSFDFAAVGGIVDGMPASHVLGQGNFVSNAINRTGVVGSDTLYAPAALQWDSNNSRLFVTDMSNNRVLSYDLAGGIDDGMAASHVLGQADFTTKGVNRDPGAGTGTVAANTVYQPRGVTWDTADSRLFVADSVNHRILSFDLAAGIIDGMAASHVLGQADFTHGAINRTGVVGSNTLRAPGGLAWDSASSRLIAADTSNHRVLTFDLAAGITDGMPASHVLGQPDFTTATANIGGIGPDTMNFSYGVAWDDVHKRLFVNDNGNHRVLYYDLDAGSACTPDANNCYVTSVAKSSLVGCTGAGDTDATFEATIPVANFADPTDAGSPFSFQAWKADAVVTDAATLAGSLAAAFEVQSLAAFSVAPSLMDYGTIALGATSTQQALTFTNTGNRGVNSSVRADGDMHSSLAGFADIASAQTHYSVSQATSWSAGTPVAATDSDVPLALPQQQADAGPAPTAPAYFYLKLPTSGIRGTYTNTLFFTAYAR